MAGQEDKLEVFRGDGKVYEHAASKIYKVPVADVTKEQRFIGKVSELACGYQGGANAFQLMAKIYGVDIPRKEAEKIKLEWRKANPMIAKMWFDYDRAVADVVKTKQIRRVGPVQFGWMNNFLVCQLPSKRRLYYFHPKVTHKKMIAFQVPAIRDDPPLTYVYHEAEYESLDAFYAHAEKAGVEPYEFNAWDFTYWGVDSKTRKFKEIFTYGGKWTENITQAVARDIMAESMLLLEERGYSIVLTVHDEIISEVTNGTVEEFTTIMERTPKWAEGLPVKVEAYEAYRYRK